QQNYLRSGTLPTPLCVGLGAAAEYFSSGEVGLKRERLRARRDKFVGNILALGWPIQLHGAQQGDHHPGNASIGFVGFDAEDILGTLQPDLAASTGSACTSGTRESSHVLKAIGLTDGDARSVIRFSL